MEKADFVAEAPRYYALAIGAELDKREITLSRKDIEKTFTYEYDNYESCVIDLDCVWKAAVGWLKSEGLVIEIKGTFGPALYARAPDFQDKWDALLSGFDAPFIHYGLVGDKHGWLQSALRDVASAYQELGVSPSDFELPSLPDSEWQPIQLDTTDPIVKNTIEKLSNAVEEIRKDNGYAATVPEERNYVVTGLEETVEKLKSGTISGGYLRDAWVRLAMVGRRFAGASLELVVNGAKQAIVEFVKSQGGELLRALLHLFH